MLTGSDLLAKVKELGDVSKSELVRECGYVSEKKDGGDRLNFTAFYEALLEAKGVNLSSGGAAIGKGGRKLSYVAKVQGNGNLLIGKAYTALLDLKVGDEFDIKLGKKAIRLIPVGGSEEDELASDSTQEETSTATEAEERVLVTAGSATTEVRGTDTLQPSNQCPVSNEAGIFMAGAIEPVPTKQTPELSII